MLIFQDIQKAREELEKKRRKEDTSEHEFLRKESYDQNAPVIKCLVSSLPTVIPLILKIDI